MRSIVLEHLLCFIITFGFVQAIVEIGGFSRMNHTEPIQPWIGIMRSKRVQFGKDSVLAGLVLIAEKTAIANANEFSDMNIKTLSNTTYAEFHNEMFIFTIEVKNCIFHPEFRDATVNTIALIFLDPGNKQTFEWKPINWPTKPYEKRTEVYLLGIPDRHKTLSQKISRMADVDNTECKRFYLREEIDFKIMWPSHTLCLKDRHESETCVYDPGMALATNQTGAWTLVGISTFSPGCSVPGRFIDVFPYTQWVSSEIDKAKLVLALQADGTKTPPRVDFLQEEGRRRDIPVVINLNTTNPANQSESLYCTCYRKQL